MKITLQIFCTLMVLYLFISPEIVSASTQVPISSPSSIEKTDKDIIISPMANATEVRYRHFQDHNLSDDIWGGLYNVTYKILTYRTGYSYNGYKILSIDEGWFRSTYHFEDMYTTY